MMALREFASVLRNNLNVKHGFFRSYNKIVMTDDGSTIVALHKEQEFPYEFSKPLPKEPELSNDFVKVDNINEIKRVFKGMSPDQARQHLASLTLTTKHRWFPRARDKRAKKTPMNRPYL